MPKIALTFPAGSLTDEAKAELPAQLANTLLHWEGAPNNEFFRSVSWAHLHELPVEAMQTADGLGQPSHFVVDVTVPQGALSDRRREGLVKATTELVMEAAGVPADEALRVWVLIDEVAEGNWGAGGNVVRFEALREAARAGRDKAKAAEQAEAAPAETPA